MQNLGGGGGQTSCIIGDVRIANEYLPGVSHALNQYFGQ